MAHSVDVDDFGPIEVHASRWVGGFRGLAVHLPSLRRSRLARATWTIDFWPDEARALAQALLAAVDEAESPEFRRVPDETLEAAQHVADELQGDGLG